MHYLGLPLLDLHGRHIEVEAAEDVEVHDGFVSVEVITLLQPCKLLSIDVLISNCSMLLPLVVTIRLFDILEIALYGQHKEKMDMDQEEDKPLKVKLHH